jgi:hypothetical protein
MNHDRTEEPLSELRGIINLLHFFARAAALPVEVFVRRLGTWGDRYLGLPSFRGCSGRRSSPPCTAPTRACPG